MGPIDYTTQVQSPFAAALQGYDAGNAIRNNQAQQIAQQQAAAQRAQQSEVLNSLVANKNPTASDYANATMLIPGLKDQFKQAWEMKSADQQQGLFKSMGQYYTAVRNGRPDIAIEQMTTQADAMERAGVSKQEVEGLRLTAKMLEASPQYGEKILGSKLSFMPGGDKVIENLSKIGQEQRASDKFPTDMRKERAETVTAEATAGIKTVEAANAPTKVGLENENARSVIGDRTAGQEIARGNLGVAQENSMTSRGNLVLDQQKQSATQGEKKQGDALAAQDALDSANALIGQIKGVQNHPGLNAGTGTMSGIRSYFNSTDANDFRKSVEGLKSPVFLNELGKLKTAGITLGQVTEAEGKKLEQRIANLDPDQSTPSFKNQVGILLKDTEKFIAKIQAGGKLPTSGGAYVMKLPRIGDVTEGDINKILAKNPGSTREQAMRYLESLSGRSGGASSGY